MSKTTTKVIRSIKFTIPAGKVIDSFDDLDECCIKSKGVSLYDFMGLTNPFGSERTIYIDYPPTIKEIIDNVKRFLSALFQAIKAITKRIREAREFFKLMRIFEKWER